jgi:hypothetical protein
VGVSTLAQMRVRLSCPCIILAGTKGRGFFPAPGDPWVVKEFCQSGSGGPLCRTSRNRLRSRCSKRFRSSSILNRTDLWVRVLSL